MSFIEEFFLFLFALLMMLTMNLKISFAKSDFVKNELQTNTPKISVLLKSN